jgi:hypothetical protein
MLALALLAAPLASSPASATACQQTLRLVSSGQTGGDARPAHNLSPELDALRSAPGYLKGPLGRRVVRALGEEEWEAVQNEGSGQPCSWRNLKTGERVESMLIHSAGSPKIATNSVL